MTPPRAPFAERSIETLLYVSLSALAVFARLSRHATVWVGDAVIAPEPDAFYHLRRATLTLEHFPRVPLRDPWLDWPVGGAATWSPGFDQLLALGPWLAGLRGASAMRAMTLVPVTLGLALVLASAALASRALSTARASERLSGLGLAGLLAALLPNSVAISTLGRTDHHIIEALFCVMGGHLLLTLSAAPARKTEGLVALWVACGIHLFSGHVMYVGVFAAAQAARALASPPARGPTPGALGLGLGALLVALADAGWIIAHRAPWHPLHLSWLQPSLVALAAAALAPLGWAQGPAWRRGLAACGVATLACLGLAALPGARDGFFAGLVGWLGTRDPWMATIDECRPLFREPPFSVAAWRPLYGLLGWVGCVFPLSLTVIWGRRELAAPLKVMVSLLTALALLQLRFVRPMVGLVAVITALAWVSAYQHLRATRWRWAVGAWLALCLGDPRLWVYLRPVQSRTMTPAVELSLHLAQRDPNPQPNHQPAIWTPWDDGFTALVIGQHPVLTSGFGPYLDRPRFEALEATRFGAERAIDAMLAARDAGWVLTGALDRAEHPGPHNEALVGTNPAGRPALDARYVAQVASSVWALGGSGFSSYNVPHLHHFWPVAASSWRYADTRRPLPGLWLYRRVAGAQLRLAPGTRGRLVARLATSVTARAVQYEAWVELGADTDALTLPLPSGWRGLNIETGPAYTLTLDGAPWGTVTVSPEAALGGREVARIAP